VRRTQQYVATSSLVTVYVEWHSFPASSILLLHMRRLFCICSKQFRCLFDMMSCGSSCFSDVEAHASNNTLGTVSDTVQQIESNENPFGCMDML
jgi:hypothetical protein